MRIRLGLCSGYEAGLLTNLRIWVIEECRSNASARVLRWVGLLLLQYLWLMCTTYKLYATNLLRCGFKPRALALCNSPQQLVQAQPQGFRSDPVVAVGSNF